MSTSTLESEYLPKDLFGMFAQTMRDRATSNESLNNAKFDKLETLIKSSSVEMKALIGNLKTDVEHLKYDVSDIKSDLKGSREDIANMKMSIGASTNEMKNIKESVKLIEFGKKENFSYMEQKFDERLENMRIFFDEKLDHVVDTLTVLVSSNEKRLEDFREEIQAEQNKSLTKLGIRIALIIGAVQVAVSIVLHFWG